MALLSERLRRWLLFSPKASEGILQLITQTPMSLQMYYFLITAQHVVEVDEKEQVLLAHLLNSNPPKIFLIEWSTIRAFLTSLWRTAIWFFAVWTSFLVTCRGQSALSNHELSTIARKCVRYDARFCNELSDWLKANSRPSLDSGCSIAHP